LAGTPLHGANQFPSEPADLRACVLEWFAHMERVGRALLGGIALALGMDAGWFAATIAAQPTHLFRIFHYPPSDGVGWGVGQHTDYGLLTILAQDDCGGLQVQMPACGGRDEQWISVPAEPNVFIVNLGDMLEKLTQGRYRSTLHRVQNSSGRHRLSFPFFVDPSWTATVQALPLDGAPPSDDVSRRWDAASVHVWSGVYGDYLAAKVARVFPDLFQRTVESAPEAV
jgi:isopenicillin N synthase-like dioxygenase